MAGGIIRYNKYICPHCGSSLSNTSIATAQAKGICPKCDGPLQIDAAQALPQTGKTVFTGSIVFVIYIFAVWGIVSLFQVNVGSFFKELHPIAQILIVAVILAPGAFLSQWAERIEVESSLRLAQEIRDEESC